MKNKIIVFGDDFWNTLGVIRSLGEYGYKSYFVNVHSGRSYVSHSRYLKKTWIVNTMQEGLDVLYRYFNTEVVKPIIISTSDKSISFLDNHYDELSAKFILPNASKKQGEINRLMDKDIMLEIADKVDLLHPRCISINLSTLKLSDIATLPVNYPCLTKPLLSINGSKEDILICEDKDELWTVLQKIKTKGCDKVQVQDYIKKEWEMLIYGCSLSSGEVIIPGIIRKIREYPFNMGATAYAEITPNVDEYIDVNIVKAYLKAIKYSGVFSMEFLLSKGKMYFMEINLRNDGNGYAPTYGGVNIPLQWLLGESGENISTMPKTINNKYNFQIDLIDLAYIRASGKGVFTWIIAFCKADFHLLFSIKDPMPFIFIFINKLSDKIQKLF